jgi:hypothetical protein
MSDNTKKLGLDLDLSGFKKKLNELTEDTRKALNPDTPGFQNQLKTLDQMKNRLDSLVGAQQKLIQQGQQGSSAYAKISTEIAGILAKQEKMVTGEEQILKLLQAETAEREKASKINQSNNQSSLLTSAKSGASDLMGSLGGGGALGSLLTAAGPIAAIGGAAKLAIDGLNALADKAKDNATKFSDGGGKFDQLSSALERAKNSADKLANSAAAVKLATLQADSETVGNSAKAALLTSLTGGSDSGSDNGPLKLKGDLLAQYTDLKRARTNMEADIAASEQQFAEDTSRKKRDLMQEEKETRIEQANKQYDLELKQSREIRDFQHNTAVLTADVEQKNANKKWEFDRQFEQRAFQQKQGDERQLATFSKQDREQQAAFSQQDRQHQLNTTLGRGAQDFNEDLVKMGISGASGTDYLFKSMDYRKQQKRTIEDSQYEGYKTDRGLAYSNFTADRDLNFKQGTEGRDFGQGQQKNQLEHQLDLATHQYQLDQQKYDLTKQYNDAMADDAEAMRRLKVERQLTEEKFKNREHDLQWDTNFQRQQMNRSESNQEYSQKQSEADFAGGIYNTNSDAFNRLTQTTPELKGWNDNYRGKRGLPTGEGKSPEEIKELQKSDMLDLAGKAEAYAAANSNPVTGFLLAGNLKKQLEDKEKEIQEKWKKLGIPFDYQPDSFADGGRTSGNGGHLAIVHPGEYIINPNATDKTRQLKLLIGAGKELGKLPAYADGGIVDMAQNASANLKKSAAEILAGLGLKGGKSNTNSLVGDNTSVSQDDYAARFAAFANSLTHKSNAEANQAGLSSFAAGSGPIFPTKYWRPDTSNAVPKADPNSYLSLLQQQQNQAPTPPPPTPIQMPGNGGDMRPVSVNIGNDQFHFNGGDSEQIQQMLGGFRQEYLAKIANAMSQLQSGFYNSQQRYTQGGRQ